MILMNCSNSVWDKEKHGNHWEGLSKMIKDFELEGIELIIDDYSPIDPEIRALTKGVHLRIYPTWYEFYKKEYDKVLEDFGDWTSIEACFGGVTAQAMIKRYKEEIKTALDLGAEYVVFHVSHVRNKDAFSMTFDYTDAMILEASAALINEIFDEDYGILLLFENLWWPGLTLLNKEDLENFMEAIHYKNKGIMLDLSHLLITQPGLKDLTEGTAYILEIIEGLGETKTYIRGLHINKSLPMNYLLEDHSHKYRAYKYEKDDMKKFRIIMDHISAIDWHVPYDHPGLKDIMALVEPEVMVFEFKAKDYETLYDYVKIQSEYIK